MKIGGLIVEGIGYGIICVLLAKAGLPPKDILIVLFSILFIQGCISFVKDIID